MLGEEVNCGEHAAHDSASGVRVIGRNESGFGVEVAQRFAQPPKASHSLPFLGKLLDFFVGGKICRVRFAERRMNFGYLPLVVIHIGADRFGREIVRLNLLMRSTKGSGRRGVFERGEELMRSGIAGVVLDGAGCVGMGVRI